MVLIRVLFVLYATITSVCFAQLKNVCKTFPDYYRNMQENDNCYYNPDSDLTVPEVIQRHGYSVEEHITITKDGYILTMFRIVNNKNASDSTRGPPVFIQHGIGHNSAAFVVRGPKSMGFILADAGYDVWLGNFRGTFYSKQHIHQNSGTRQYWDFSFHEMGIYDLPAQLDLIWEVTGRKITYIGYSMGNTAAYIYAITYPEAALERIKVFVGLAPIAFLDHITSFVKYITPFWIFIEPAFHLLSNNGRVPIRDPNRMKSQCLPYPFQMQLCSVVQNLIFGSDFQQDDPETLPITIIQNKDDTSLKILNHYIQFIKTGRFQQYDYGIPRNLLKYGAPFPPLYNLTKIRVPVVLVRGENDLLATKANVEKLYVNLPQTVKHHPIYTVSSEKFSHTDFLTAKDIVSLLFEDLLYLLNIVQ